MNLACNLNAIAVADRPRYKELVSRLRSAVRERQEIGDGFEFRLDEGRISLAEIGEWIGMERLCCPFLELQVSASGSQPHWLLTLRGPEGVQPILEAEFPPV